MPSPGPSADRDPAARHDAAGRVHDVVGVGFGPSNLALAIAVAEHNAAAAPGDRVSARFLERQAGFGWHRGMLIDDATMQVSFLKDLATMRNPTSRFSFLAYLHGKGRLVDFINHKSLFPLRVEFHDYFEWAAQQVADQVDYGAEVVEVRPVVADGSVEHVEVVARAAHGTTVVRARNVVLATGLRARLPAGVTPSDRVWHTGDFLHRLESLAGGARPGPDARTGGGAGAAAVPVAVGPAAPRRFVVVGAGQSAAEVTALLHDRFRGSEVCAVFARYGYSPADDSSFANRIFDPDAVDHFFTAPDAVKDALVGYHANTNYSVVDAELIDELYRRVYREKVTGHERLRIFNVSRVVELAERDADVRVTVDSLSTGERTTLDADVVVYATGYRPADPTPMLGELAGWCRRDEHARLRVERDYRVVTDPQVRCGVYLQGGTEHSHGISSSLLSTTAVRVGEILRSIVARRPSPIGPDPARLAAARG